MINNGFIRTSGDPEGWALESLLDRLRVEIMERNIPLYEEESLVMKNILRNNEQIIGLLFQMEALARLNNDLLEVCEPAPKERQREGQARRMFQNVSVKELRKN